MIIDLRDNKEVNPFLKRRLYCKCRCMAEKCGWVSIRVIGAYDDLRKECYTPENIAKTQVAVAGLKATDPCPKCSGPVQFIEWLTRRG